MEEDVPADPGDVRLLGAPAPVARLKCVANPVEEPGLGWTRVGGLADRERRNVRDVARDRIPDGCA
jgi:hypothetical protein